MHKLFSIKLISKNPRNASTQMLRSNPISLHRAADVQPPHYHHGFTRYTTSPPSLQQAPTNCSRKVLSNPVLLNRVLPNALLKLKLPGKFFVGHGGFGFPRAQFRRQSSQFDQPISYQKTWQSQLRRRFTTNGVVIGLIVTNVAVFLLWRVADRGFMMQNFMIQLDNFKSGRFHTMITSAFSHIEFRHIFSNTTVLYFFGRRIRRQFGPEFLLKLYLAGAFIGSTFFLVHHAFLALSSKGRPMWLSLVDKNVFSLSWLPFASIFANFMLFAAWISMCITWAILRDSCLNPTLQKFQGASGAVDAIMLLDIFLFPKKTIYINFIIPLPAILVGIFLIGYDIMRIQEGNSQVSGSAHLGGAAVAVVAWARLRKWRF